MELSSLLYWCCPGGKNWKFIYNNWMDLLREWEALLSRG